MTRRNELNLNSQHNSTCILRNKFYFGLFADALNIKTGHNVCLAHKGVCYLIDEKKSVLIQEFVDEYIKKKLFCKLLDGECGVGIFTLEKRDDELFYDGNKITLNELVKITDSGRYIFQEAISQHTEIARIYDKSINTIRLVTIRNPHTETIEILPSVLRIGANGNYVDNFAKGGLCVGFDEESGRLNDTAFYKPGYGLRAFEHPNSGVKFSTFCIPYIHDAIHDAKFFHSMLADIHSIGWDIAISENGPIFIEGNDNWEISLHQVCHQGLRFEFEKYFF